MGILSIREASPDEAAVVSTQRITSMSINLMECTDPRSNDVMKLRYDKYNGMMSIMSIMSISWAVHSMECTDPRSIDVMKLR